ncbi:MAG: hypothetical protein M1274_14245 [Actinobacteria bacterium]|nr:hypothetical protein [Actinomycetota bacterium]
MTRLATKLAKLNWQLNFQFGELLAPALESVVKLLDEFIARQLYDPIQAWCELDAGLVETYAEVKEWYHEPLVTRSLNHCQIFDEDMNERCWRIC